jgi:Carboxypeptidase regulatory-like domain
LRGVWRSSLKRWKRCPEFRARVTEHLAAGTRSSPAGAHDDQVDAWSQGAKRLLTVTTPRKNNRGRETAGAAEQRRKWCCAPCVKLTQNSILRFVEYNWLLRASDVYRLLLLLALGFAGAGFAQSPEAKLALEGIVLDPTGAGVGGARVTLQLSGSATPVIVRSDAIGAFRFEGVSQGSYTVTAEHDGFQPGVSQIRMGSRPPAPLAIRLKVADLQSEVTVTEHAVQLSTNSADNLDTVTLDRQSLDDLPIFDQDYVGAMSRFLDAGAVASGGVTLIVDGLEATRAGVSASAIQEVRINQDPYSAEFPRPGRGRIEIITKPGSAQFHGTFNFLFRDFRLNARDPFSLTRPFEQRRIFEGSFTGPLGLGKKTSFLISGNREEEDQQAIVFAQGLSGPIQQTLQGAIPEYRARRQPHSPDRQPPDFRARIVHGSNHRESRGRRIQSAHSGGQLRGPRGPDLFQLSRAD